MDYLSIEAFLVGRCGMSCEQAGWVSFHEFAVRSKAYEEKEREDWSKRRWELFILMQMHPHIKSYNKPTTPEKWIAFPWEKQNTPQDGTHIVTDAEINKLTQIFKKRSN